MVRIARFARIRVVSQPCVRDAAGECTKKPAYIFCMSHMCIYGRIYQEGELKRKRTLLFFSALMTSFIPFFFTAMMTYLAQFRNIDPVRRVFERGEGDGERESVCVRCTCVHIVRTQN